MRRLVSGILETLVLLTTNSKDSENDNLRQEYSNLLQDVPADIAFARIALEKQADAINLWIGNELSVTSLHKDNYENIYVQVRGQKHFVLLPPIEMPCTNEQLLPKTRYRSVEGHSSTWPEDLTFDAGEEDCQVPVATWDPDDPLKRLSKYSHLSTPLRITLDEGDLLYLPAMWYHKVSQSSGVEGFACAVNYWYDMEFAGGFWAANNFLRDVTNETGSI
jgi:peptidyl-lysine (3S)-dioxygenase / protease